MSQDPQRLVLLDLPPEILTAILFFLPDGSILACQRVNHYLKNLISSSAKVQYTLHRSLTAQLDNPHSSLFTKERLAKLLLKENHWEDLTINFNKPFKVPFLTSGIYDLTGGVYLLGESSRKALHYTYLPSEPDQEIVWQQLRTDGIIIDMGLCVYEHDLIAVITTQPKISGSDIRPAHHSPEQHDVRLQLNQVSTGLPHPEALQPIISVMATRWERPAVGIEIVGDNLVLVLAYYENPSRPDDQVFIYHWKTGRLKMQLSAPYHSYSSLLFLTTDIILLPNTNTGRLEYWKIPEREVSHDISPQPFFALALPKLRANSTFGHISCRADPNPTTTFRHSSKPFIADPNHAIAVFNVNVRSGNVVGPGLIPHVDRLSSFVFFVHRSSLVGCLERFPDAISHDGSNPEPVPYSQWGPPICRWFAAEAFPTRWITTTGGQRCVIIQDISTESDSAPLILLNFNQKDVKKILALEEEDRDTRARALWVKRYLARSRRKQRQGDRKGESRAGGSTQNDSIEQMAAALSITSQPGWNPRYRGPLDDDGDDYRMDDLYDDDSDDCDSNPSPQQLDQRRRRVKAMKRESDALDDRSSCFQNFVYSSLPYTVCSSKEKYGFKGVLLDEERILGLETNLLQRITKVDILHYG